jgi:hypothetical protein
MNQTGGLQMKCRCDLPAFFKYFSWLILLSVLTGTTSAQNTIFQFYPGGVYSKNVPTPEKILGFQVGSRPARYAEAVNYFNILASSTPRVKLVEMGETFEGRKLHYLVISNESHIQNLEQIKTDINKLGDPRLRSASTESDRLIRETPAIAWMMYGIHGDELSGPDAAIQLAYQLAAGEDSLSKAIRQELVVCIHPMENPDGRERFLAQMQQWQGMVPHTDIQTINHTGSWPWGRGNHYLFDLNRDWFLLVNPETRARVRAILEWSPQLVVDIHEMGSLDTYLFSPGREPINPHIKSKILDWLSLFSRDQAKAMDQYSWSYYTREWLDEWYPGYGSEWPLLLSSVSILYEQAGTDGSAVRRRDGSILTYRESVHHQFVSSLANLTTASQNRIRLLQDFYSLRKEAIRAGKNKPAAFYIVPDQNVTRLNQLLRKLLFQHIEIEKSKASFTVASLHGYLNSLSLKKTLPPGTYIIPLNQPFSPLIQAIMEFDPRMSSQFLQDERSSLLRDKDTRMYEVSAWSLPMAYDLEIYWSENMPGIKTERVTELPEKGGVVESDGSGFGYLCDYRDDASVMTLVELFKRGAVIRVAQKPLRIAGRNFERGTILLRKNENGSNLSETVKSIAGETGANFTEVHTALAQNGPDLGGNEFSLLVSPRIALLAGPQINLTNFSAMWFLLDQKLKIDFSILNSDRMRGFDLRKYNVLILPSAWSVDSYKSIFNKDGVSRLKNWVQEGGTLIGIEEAAAFLADTAIALSQTRIMRQVLPKRDFYEKWISQQEKLKTVKIDSLYIWEGGKKISDTTRVKTVSREQLEWTQKNDELARLFHPRGAILRGWVDQEHWLSYGLKQQIPLILYTSYAFLAMDPVRIPVSFSVASDLRLSGLLWPEAASRWANTAYLTVERIGKGQVILFAGDPFFRAYFEGSGRLLINSLLLGPGCGTDQGVPW